jgi:6-phosphogluconolactonase
MTQGAVYVQTNEAENKVVHYGRDSAGQLERIAAVETGGSGDGKAHLASQGSVVLAADGNHLFVANSASDDLSVFSVAADGSLDLIGRTPVGPAPKSVAEHGGLVYVLATGGPAVAGFRLDESGLEALAGAEQALSPDADPAQVGLTPDGSTVVVTERGTNSITAFLVQAGGKLGASRTVPSSGPTPYGFAFTPSGTLVVSEAFGAQKGKAAASSYSIGGAEITPVTKSVGSGRSEICWVVVTPDGRYAFATNFADGAVSRFSIAGDGSLQLDDATAAFSVDGRPGLRDESLTADGAFLYAIDADSGSIFGWGVAPDGALSPVGSWDGLPDTVAGLACR